MLVVDCLGTLIGKLLEGAEGYLSSDEYIDPSHEVAVFHAAHQVVSALEARPGLSIVVTNEVGWGIVPAHPSARLFRDVVGRANRDLVAVADPALLVVAGRVITLSHSPSIEEF